MWDEFDIVVIRGCPVLDGRFHFFVELFDPAFAVGGDVGPVVAELFADKRSFADPFWWRVRDRQKPILSSDGEFLAVLGDADADHDERSGDHQKNHQGDKTGGEGFGAAEPLDEFLLQRVQGESQDDRPNDR